MRIYVALGCYREGNTVKVITPDQAGLMFIAWRCLYAGKRNESRKGCQAQASLVRVRVKTRARVRVGVRVGVRTRDRVRVRVTHEEA